MRTKLFILGVNEDKRDHTFESILERTFQPVLAPEDGLQCYQSVRDATTEIGRAFTDSDSVFFFVEAGKYGDLKQVLCRAFGLELRVNEQLLLGAQKSAPELEEKDLHFSVAHAGLPERADVFVLSDSLYAGFAVRRGRQTLFLLPWERERTGVLLTNQVIPYLNARARAGLSPDPIRFYSVEALRDAMVRQDIKIAVAGTKTESLFRRFVSVNPELAQRVMTVRKTTPRGTTPPGEYMVNLSITAAEFMGLPYGVAISNAYYTGNDPAAPKTVYLAVTNDEETTLRKLTSFYGESTADFLFRCCRELCALLTQIINVDAGLVKKDEKAEKDKLRRKKKRFKVAIVTVLVMLLALGGGTWYYFTSHNYSIQDWVQTYIHEDTISDWFRKLFPFLHQDPIMEGADQTHQAVDSALLTDAPEQ